VNIGVLLSSVSVEGSTFNQLNRAVMMAVDEINGNQDILPNTSINAVVNSTRYDRWTAMQATLWQVNVAKVVAIIGGANPSEVKVVSPIVSSASVPLLSPLAFEFELESNDQYPTFFRVGAAYDRLDQVVRVCL
jgi:ABC-type branched-subunit amino acid transport system substrate-binding protein